MIGRGQFVEVPSCILFLFTLVIQRDNMLCKLLRILTVHEVTPLLTTSDTHLSAILLGNLILFTKGDIHNVWHELDMILAKDKGGFAYVDTIWFGFLCFRFFCFCFIFFGVHMNLFGCYLDFLCLCQLLDFYLRVIL